jgi:hypothetical protein
MSQSPYMTVKEVAAHYRVALSTVYESCGDFAELKRTRVVGRTPGKGKILILLSSVELLDRKLARIAKAASDPVDELHQCRSA